MELYEYRTLYTVRKTLHAIRLLYNRDLVEEIQTVNSPPPKGRRLLVLNVKNRRI